MTTLEVNGTTLDYIEKGDGDPVVFVHGSASDSRIWTEIQRVAAEQFRTINYSRRFHWPNATIADGVDYSMVDHVEDLKELLAALSPQPVHLVGHSYGALVAINLAIHEPQRIRSLVLAEPPAISLYVKNSNEPKPSELLKLLFTNPSTGLAVMKLGATGLGPAAKAAKKGDMEGAMRLFGKSVLGEETYERMTDERRQQALSNFHKAELLGSGFVPLQKEDVQSIQIPTLLLTGEKSPRVFHRLADRLEELLPNVERAQIEDASHILQEDNPEQFADVMISFVGRSSTR